MPDLGLQSGQHIHKPQFKVLCLSQPCSRPSSAKGETCVWCRCWSGTSLAPSCCCFLLRWFLTNMCGMHNQHLGEAAVGKRKLTQNINSQILKCTSVAARLALGMSLAEDCWEAAYFVCGLQRGNFGGYHTSQQDKK